MRARPMIGPGLALLGLLSLAGAALLLRAVGPAYRVARLLAVAPEVTLAEAAAMARSGERRYVRVDGRVSSDEEFPDENDRPLVYRRTRLQAASRRGWTTLYEDRAAVPFGLERRGDYVAVDARALDEGLIVIRREASGRRSELPDDILAILPPDVVGPLAPDTPVRLLVEQVSAVEHAVAAGLPAIGADGSPVLAAGLGRPLILTTVEVPAAMRILGRDRRRYVLAAAALLVVGLALLAASVVALVASG